MLTNISEVVSEETQRSREQREMEAAERAAIVALVESIPQPARKALARRAGDTVAWGGTPTFFFLYPAKPHQSPASWCYWMTLDYPEIGRVKPAFGFSLTGELVRVMPYSVVDDDGMADVQFSSKPISAEDFADAVSVSDGYASVLAGRLQEGLDTALAELRKRRERVRELKETAEHIAQALA